MVKERACEKPNGRASSLYSGFKAFHKGNSFARVSVRIFKIKQLAVAGLKVGINAEHNVRVVLKIILLLFNHNKQLYRLRIFSLLY